MADTIKTNLGPVTAYADAKAHGYTGTREDVVAAGYAPCGRCKP